MILGQFLGYFMGKLLQKINLRMESLQMNQTKYSKASKT